MRPTVVKLPKPSPEAIRVMVVEDQGLFRESLVRLLGGQPGIVIAGDAATGEEALRLLPLAAPDVILMDVGLPGIDGIETSRRIKAANPAVKVVVFTAFPGPEMFRRAIQADVDSFILKDATVDEVVTAIRVTYADGHIFKGDMLTRLMNDSGAAKRHPRMTPAEVVVLQALTAGGSNRELAQRLNLSEKTVRNHLSNVYSKLGVSGRAEAVLYAVEHGFLTSTGR
jgi:NarL family two-component system response regulator LiaR